MDNSPIAIEKLIEVAQQAGAAILEIYNSDDFSVEEKSDNSPLTAADLASHNIITQALATLTPDIPVLSEESANIPFETRQSWTRYWLIDPLDGTKEFIKRNGEFTVNIALVEAHQATIGVVYVPVTGLTFYGIKGDGAYTMKDNSPATPIQVNRNRRTPLQVAGSRSHAGDSLKQFLDNVGEHEIVSMGSSLKCCLVADGTCDLYPRLGPTSEWDTAAAQAVVEAAGGQITLTNMTPLRYNTKESLLNPHFFVFGDSSINWSEYLGEETG
ncbi:MAG: 3'(2'),5'-bisphosphate nucleotidase CysQ [Chromatiales bacterium]|nr:3'(2'),5'-bisphosphate nucleotidase CysQ [Chromatiales bacterium]